MSSDDEESRPSALKKKNRTESSKRSCIIHIRRDVKGDVTGFKEKAWQVRVALCFDSICKFRNFGVNPKKRLAHLENLIISFFLFSHNLKFIKQIVYLKTLAQNKKQNVTQKRLNISLPISSPKINVFLFQICYRSSARRGDGIIAKFSTITDNETFGYHRQCYQSYTNEKSLKNFDRENQEEELP